MIWVIVLVMLVPLVLFFYARSVSSRKTYVCPRCGEELRVELMEASRCNVCGSVLERTN